MRWWSCLVLAGCCPRLAVPAPAAQAAPLATAEASWVPPPPPVIECPRGTTAVPVPIESYTVPCEPNPMLPVVCRPDVEWHRVTLCGQAFDASRVTQAVACRRSDGKVDGPFAIETFGARTDGTCKADVLHGPFSRYLGTPHSEQGQYEDGLQEGDWIYPATMDHRTVFATNTIRFHAGVMDGPMEQRRLDGTLMSRSMWAGGKQHGLSERWDDGVRSTFEYEHGRLVGFDRRDHGARRMCTTWPAGDEECRFWNPQGALVLEGKRRSGATHGSWTAWYPTGERLGTTTSAGTIVVMFEVASTDGRQQLWYRDGTRLADTTCAAGEARGRWRVWYPDGTLHFDRDLDTRSFHSYAPDGSASEEAARCDLQDMGCMLIGSGGGRGGCDALATFTMSVPAHRER